MKTKQCFSFCVHKKRIRIFWLWLWTSAVSLKWEPVPRTLSKIHWEETRRKWFGKEEEQPLRQGNLKWPQCPFCNFRFNPTNLGLPIFFHWKTSIHCSFVRFIFCFCLNFDPLFVFDCVPVSLNAQVRNVTSHCVCFPHYFPEHCTPNLKHSPWISFIFNSIKLDAKLH